MARTKDEIKEHIAAVAKVIRSTKTGKRAADIATETGLDRKVVEHALTHLRGLGKIRMVGDRRFAAYVKA
jgi:hypothetical protein